MQFVHTEARHRAWRDLVLSEAFRERTEPRPLPPHIDADRRRAARAAYDRHAKGALRAAPADRRFERQAFIEAEREAALDILERMHAVFWHLGLAAIEKGYSQTELRELALFQTAMTAVWVNSVIRRGTDREVQGSAILEPPVEQIRQVMGIIERGGS